MEQNRKRYSDNSFQVISMVNISIYVENAIQIRKCFHFPSLGIIVAGYGSGLMRIFSVPDGNIVAEIDAHAGWITGMDLASQTGRLVTTAEDGVVRVSVNNGNICCLDFFR